MALDKDMNREGTDSKNQNSSSSETSQDSTEITQTSNDEVTSGNDIKWDDFLGSEIDDDIAEEEAVASADEPLQEEESSKEEKPAKEDEEEKAAAQSPDEPGVAAEESESEEPVAPDYEAIRQILGKEAADAAIKAAKETEQQTQETQTEVQTQQQQPAETEDESAEQRMQALREQAMTEVSEQFKLSEDEVEKLREDPNTVLPQLLSKVFISTFDSLMQGINRQLPQKVAQIIDYQQRTAEGQQAFYTVWPQLNKPEYRQVVDRVAGAYKSVNPNASLEQAIREVGAQAWIALRLPLDQLNEHVKNFAAPPSAPQNPAPQQTFRKPANEGHVPAGRVNQQQTTNEWEEFLDED